MGNGFLQSPALFRGCFFFVIFLLPSVFVDLFDYGPLGTHADVLPQVTPLRLLSPTAKRLTNRATDQNGFLCPGLVHRTPKKREQE